MTHRRNVPSGQRHALLARRNTAFERCIDRTVGEANNDDECMTGDHMGENTPLTQSTMTNNESAGPSNPNASATPEQPLFDDTDDDERGIFEDDDEEDEAYMFAGQESAESSNQYTSATPEQSLFLFDDIDDDEGDIFEEDEEEDEGYLFAGHEESDDDVQSETPEDDTASNPEVLDPYEKVYSNMPTETHMLKPAPDCRHCGAKRFPKEPPRFCCRNGKIELSQPVVPDQLMRLYTSSDVDARHFRNNIRFSMATSLSLPSTVASTVLLLT